MTTKTIIIGLDGANWELLEPWIEEGVLPNLEELRERATWGDHQSQLPPTTFPNWKCYSTGQDPGQLGVYWFEMIDMESKEVKIPNSNDFQGSELWDYLNNQGLEVGVLNMPTMFPPKDLDGFVVCGGPGTSEGVYREIGSGYASPQELEEELEEKYDYEVHPSPYLASRENSEEEVEAIHDVLEMRLEVALNKMEDVDVLHVTLFYLNVLQHFFWNEEPTEEAWKIVDEYIGKFMEKCDENSYNLVLMSDHGCTEIHTEFFMNRWLEQEGYYVRKTKKDDYLRRVGLNRENLLDLAKTLKMDSLIHFVPERIQELIPHEEGAVRARKMELADWDDSVAVASGQGPIYLDLERGTEEYEDVRDEIIEKLETIEAPGGRKVFEDVYRSEELYGELNGFAPDIVVSQNKGFTVSDRVGAGELFSEPEKWRAENEQTGMYLFSGPEFKARGEWKQIDILDISPTIFSAVTGKMMFTEGKRHSEVLSEK
jgi:predicted AlkP superfamily phosphohydrolase/phosphomutase